MTTATLRDIFAPGWLSMSGPHVTSRTSITVQFFLATAALAYAFRLMRGHYPKSANHK